ncbi:MAG: rod shape-determining protein [Candidatus Malihini olakiniferum]
MVKDGIVVDYLAATRVVKQLKQQLETRLGRSLTHAATVILLGIFEVNTNVIFNVVESSGLFVTHVIDEPVAAATLNIHNGAVVDVVGGTTRLSVLRNGKVLFSPPTSDDRRNSYDAGAGRRTGPLSYADAKQLKYAPGTQEGENSLSDP